MLILNATGAVNFSQGDLVMVGGFVAVVLAGALRVPGLALLPLLLAGMAALGGIVALLAYMPLRRRPPEAVFISTIAVGIILQNTANRLFGAQPVAAPPLLGAGRVRFAGIEASVQSLAIIAVAALLIV
ncbi:MAG: branched-chain amino acid ABC transporter permease, partial [Acetobacteraceae bacterium]